jgi:peptide/nickel transport system permease protein
MAEAACLDMVFLADGIGLRTKDEPAGALCRSQQTLELEPLTLLSALALMTERIGLASTASTTYNEPFHIARKWASLDHLSGAPGGWAALLAGRLADMVQTFPPIIDGVMITGVLGPGATNLVLALAVICLPNFFRIGRAAALAEAQLTYVEAARAAGFAEPAILLRQVLPNVLPVLALNFVTAFPLALQIEAALGFLGLGVVPPAPDWGAILEQGKNFILVAWWVSLWPGAFVLASAAAMALLGRGLREKLGR